MLDVSAFGSQISWTDGSSVTYWAHTPHISLLEFTGSSQKVERVMSHDSLLESAAACSGAATEILQ